MRHLLKSFRYRFLGHSDCLCCGAEVSLKEFQCLGCGGPAHKEEFTKYFNLNLAQRKYAEEFVPF